MHRANTERRITYRQQMWLVGVMAVGLILLGLISGVAIAAKGWFPLTSLNKVSGAGGNAPFYVTPRAAAAGQGLNNTGFSAVAKAVTPAVVTVEVSARARTQPFPFFSDPFMDPFRDFFGRPDPDEGQLPRRNVPPQQQQRPESRGRLQPSGLGSGVIVSPEGYILTNNHVVQGAERVEVVLNDRRRLTAKVVGTDPPSDVAVLKVDANGLPTLTLGDSNQMEVGDLVLAVGNPLGVGQTVTLGIISAKGRSTRSGAGSGSFEDFLQTDAAINRGNSGGALVNIRGELIGIPSQILSQTGGSIGIGFAIPTNMARNVMDQLIRTGKVQRGRLGITISQVLPEIAQQFGYQGTRGALVQDVESGQPAERAGIKPGDIVTEFQGQRVEDDAQFRNLVAQTAPGTSVRLKVWRDGAEREFTATLAALDPQTVSGRTGGGSQGAQGSALAGVQVSNLTPEMTRQLNLPANSRGVVITEVATDSGAAYAGLRRGDVIEEVNRQPVSNVNEFNAALQKAGQSGARQSVLLRVRRPDGARYVVVRPQE